MFTFYTHCSIVILEMKKEGIEMKLSKEQERVYNNIISSLKLAKECETFKEYHIRERMDGFKDRADYEDILKYENEKFNKNEKMYEQDYMKYYINAKEHNRVLCVASSSTLRALEKKGLIKIVVDGGKYVDTVEVLEVI